MRLSRAGGYGLWRRWKYVKIETVSRVMRHPGAPGHSAGFARNPIDDCRPARPLGGGQAGRLSPAAPAYPLGAIAGGVQGLPILRSAKIIGNATMLTVFYPAGSGQQTSIRPRAPAMLTYVPPVSGG